EYDRHETHHDGRDVAIASANHSEKNANPGSVDRKDDKRRDDGEYGPSDTHAEEDEHKRHDHHVVCKHNQVTAHVAPSVDREWQPHLRNNVLRRQESLTAFDN